MVEKMGYERNDSNIKHLSFHVFTLFEGKKRKEKQNKKSTITIPG